MPKQSPQRRRTHKRMSYETSGPKGLSADAPWGLVLAWVTYIGMISCNFAFDALRLGGVTTAEVSNQVLTWFSPAPYAFAIWTLIYAGLGIWLVALTRDELRLGRAANPYSLLFAATCVLNVAWLVLFHFEQVALSVAGIIVYWGAVALLYSAMHVPGKRLILRAPISLYLGWVSAGVIFNATNLASRALGNIVVLNEVSSVALALAVLGMGFIMAKMADDYLFPLACLWAVVAVGVHLAQISPPVAAIVITLCAVGALLTFIPFEISRPRSSPKTY